MSKRDNELRSGAMASPDTLIPPILEQNPNEKNFSFVAPTRFVELPSRGRFYPEEHRLHNISNIEIRFMTAKDEDILTSKTLLKKGLAIDRFLKNILVDKSIDIDELLLGDKNALIIAARTTGYGSLYQTKVTCPACSSRSEYEFDLDFCSIDHGEDFTGYDITEVKEGYFNIKLPVTELIVTVKLLSGADEKKVLNLFKIKKIKKRNNISESSVTDLFRILIKSINGSADRYHIDQFIESMPAMDSKYLRKAYEKITPGIDMSQDFVCEFCGTDTELEVPLNAEFFWP